MTQEDFNNLLERIWTTHIKDVMCKKSAEYASGGDKLHNFKRAAQMNGVSPIEALRGMKLKHDVSINDMLDGLKEGKEYTQLLWEEKLHDDINYYLLLWALLYETYDWK